MLSEFIILKVSENNEVAFNNFINFILLQITLQILHKPTKSPSFPPEPSLKEKETDSILSLRITIVKKFFHFI